MIRYIIMRWYAVVSLALLYLFTVRFIENYPPGLHEVSGKGKSVQQEASLLSVLDGIQDRRRPLKFDSAVSEQWDPFLSMSVKKTARKRTAVSKQGPAPRRNYKLTGTTNNRTAILTNNAGQSVIVQVGDKVDSAQVLGIGPDKVILRDRGGKFEIRMNE